MKRTVRLSPLTVVISLLIGAALAGLVGALLAIPAAGITQILVREFVPGFRQADSAHPTGEREDQSQGGPEHRSIELD
jgi:predicted PurR-regulated permease PerM